MRRGQRVQRKHKDTKKEKTSSSWGRRSTGTKTKTNKNISLSWRGINGYKDKATKKEKISTSWGGAGGQRVPWGSRLISTNFLLPPWIMLRQLLVIIIIIIICIIIALYGGSETTVSFVESPFFGVIKFKLNITTWLVHFGRAWKRLNINGLHFIICQVILRGVWCRKWEGFAKFFFMDEQSSGMRLLGSKWSRRAFTKWWDSVRECVHQLAVENIQGLFKKYSKNIQSESEHQLSVENIQRMERNFEKVEAAGKLADSWIVNFQTLHLEERS